MAAPGWYPDPAGTGGRRYWDGYAWHDAVPARPGPIPPQVPAQPTNWRALGIFLGMAVAGLIAFAVIGRLTAPDGNTASLDRIVDVCQDAVRQQLKDPESARFTGWRAWEVRDGVYSAAGAVNAKNSFGGYAGDSLFSCDATVADGEISATAIDASDVIAPYLTPP